MLVQVGHLNGEVKIYNLQEQSTAGQLMEVLGLQLACNVQLVNCGELVSASSILGTEGIYYVTVDAEGGKKKKKKKKNFATAKKKKHRHRKIKLLTLKLYTLDKSGQVTRSHKQCPSCPPGVYMAKHFDRHYCGTCHQTLRMDEATIKANLEQLKKQQAAKAAAAPTDAGAGKDAGAAKGKAGKKAGKKK